MKRFFIVLVAAIIFSNAAVSGSWSFDNRIKGLRAYSNGSTAHYVKFTDYSVNEGCSVTSQTGAYILEDESGRSYSALLAAFTSEKAFSFQVDGCINGYAKIVEVQSGDW